MAFYTGYSSDSTASSIDPEQPIKSRVAASVSCAPVGNSLADKLRLAAGLGQTDRVHELISAGACFDFDGDGRTALHYAAANGFVDCVHILIKSGAVINACDKMGYTAVHQAAAHGHLEVVHLLASFACFLDTQDIVHGNTPLHDTAWYGHSRTVQYLVQCGATVQQLNKASFSALHLAAQNGHNQTARFLLYAGCSAEHKNNYGDTALHTAARYGHAGITRILLSAHCNINECNKNLDTALHIAAALKRHKIAKLLLESGINSALKNKQGERAFDVALRKQHIEIVNLLSAKMMQVASRSAGSESIDNYLRSSETSVDGEETDGTKKKKKKKLFFFKKNKSKDKEKQSDTESHSSVPSQDSMCAPMQYRPTAEQLVLGFQLHRLQQQQRNQFTDRLTMPDYELKQDNRGFSVDLGSNNVIQTNQGSLFKAPLPPPQFFRHQATHNQATSKSRDEDMLVMEHRIRSRLHLDDSAVPSHGGHSRGPCRGPYAVPDYPSRIRQSEEIGNRLFRSKSDETLSNYSFRMDDRARAALTLKRKNGINSKVIRKDFLFDTDDLVTEDMNISRVPEGRSASGSAEPYVEESGRGKRNVPMMTIPVSVAEWFARNEMDGASMKSSCRVKPFNRRSAAVHDL